MVNEFRQDLVSGDWVLISTERSKKPSPKESNNFYKDKEACPFEGSQKSDLQDPILVYNKGNKIEWSGQFKGEWTTQVVKNKFPALKYGLCVPPRDMGPFTVIDGLGFHELVITRDHEKSFAQFTNEETLEVLKAYKERYNSISDDKCGDYVSIFHNHGHLSGASQYHNHSQILSTPIVPPGMERNIRGAKNYFERTGKRVHEAIIDWEISQNKRIVHENEKFISLCPFASRATYEVRIFPKKDVRDFGDTEDSDLSFLAESINCVLKKLYLGLDNPDYTFFIHSTPVKKNATDEHDFYRWHVEIMPRFSIVAGMEFGTNIFVNTVDPDEAAELLRKTKI